MIISVSAAVAWSEIAVVLAGAIIGFLAMGYMLRDILRDGKKGKNGWNGSS